MRTLYLCIYWLFFAILINAKSASPPILWEDGWLEIHHINTKIGNATFFIFPDGSTMLYDAGEIDIESLSKEKRSEYGISNIDKLNASEIIIDYIDSVYPSAKPKGIDYAIISHFHADHYSTITSKSRKASCGKYKLSGITEVYEKFKLNTIIDRGYPHYDYPVNLRLYYENSALDKRNTFNNYIKFQKYIIKSTDSKFEKLKVGCDSQISLIRDKNFNFNVRVVNANNEYWSGSDNSIRNFDFNTHRILNEKQKFNENALSIGLLITYGNFKYYTGGDICGVNKWPDVDIESQVAPIIGKVSVMTLNHHGYKDASNSIFLSALEPKVIVHQSLHSPHFQSKILNRIFKTDARKYALSLPSTTDDEIKSIVQKEYSGWNNHIVVKVSPDGNSYYVNNSPYSIPD